jgi:hypothetical protein
MRRLFIGLVVAATTVVVPALALASNQEVADRIAGNLRDSGQLQGYQIGVKCQDGTAWLRGRVASEEQLAKALKIAWQTEGVDRVIQQLEVAQPASTRQSRLRTPESVLAAEQLTQAAPQRQQRYTSRTVSRLQQVVDDEAVSAPRRATRLASSYNEQPATPASTMTMVQPAVTQPVRQPVMMRSNRPMPVAYINGGQPAMMPEEVQGSPMPQNYGAPVAAGAAPVRYDQPCMPNCAWPSYAAYPNYAAVTYPKQYSPTAWPFIGPFYPYPQVPLGWRKVTLEWDDGWWMLDFKDGCCN